MFAFLFLISILSLVVNWNDVTTSYKVSYFTVFIAYILLQLQAYRSTNLGQPVGILDFVNLLVGIFLFGLGLYAFTY